MHSTTWVKKDVESSCRKERSIEPSDLCKRPSAPDFDNARISKLTIYEKAKCKTWQNIEILWPKIGSQPIHESIHNTQNSASLKKFFFWKVKMFSQISFAVGSMQISWYSEQLKVRGFLFFFFFLSAKEDLNQWNGFWNKRKFYFKHSNRLRQVSFSP